MVLTKMVTWRWTEGSNLSSLGSFDGLVEEQVVIYGCVAELFAIGDLLLDGNMSTMDSSHNQMCRHLLN